MVRKNNFDRDETQDQNLEGDGCYNCMNNPRFQTRRRNMGKPNIEPETFDEEMNTFAVAYGFELEKEIHDVYWEHLAFAFISNQEFKDTMYQCIDTFTEIPSIADILQTMMQIRINTF